MRWRSKNDLRSSVGKMRVVKKFLLWPRTFDSIRTRWLETAWIVETVRGHSYCDGGGGPTAWSWVEIGFADEPQSSDWKMGGEPVYDLYQIAPGQPRSLEDAIACELPVVGWSDPACPYAVFKREYLFVKACASPSNPPPPPPTGGTGVSRAT